MVICSDFQARILNFVYVYFTANYLETKSHNEIYDLNQVFQLKVTVKFSNIGSVALEILISTHFRRGQAQYMYLG